MFKRKVILLLLVLFYNAVVFSIEKSDSKSTFISSSEFKSYEDIVLSDSLAPSDCQIMDVGDVLYSIFHKKTSPLRPVKIKKLSLLILPSFSVNPANGVMLGLNGTGSWYFGDRKTTRMSTANSKVVVTSEKQLITYVKSSIYTKNDNYFLDGDWRFYLYSLPTYGLGTNAPDTVFDPNLAWLGVEHAGGNGSYPMKYDYAIFHQLVNKRIKKNYYAGLGYHLDAYWNIKDELLNLDTIPKQLTPHWTYSHLNNIDPTEYLLSGLSLNFMFDSRDNLNSPYKGYYVKVNYRYNFKFLGSTTETSELYAEFRTYVGLSKRTPRHLLAFWAFGNFQLSGTMPYFTLMSLGDDQKGTSGRGYIAGRYRGENIVYGEVEYRFPILRCAQTLGGVVFVNAVSTTNKTRGVRLFDYVKPAVGFGIRILMNKNVRLNVSIDYAIGYRSQGFYFNSSDAF